MSRHNIEHINDFFAPGGKSTRSPAQRFAKCASQKVDAFRGVAWQPQMFVRPATRWPEYSGAVRIVDDQRRIVLSADRDDLR